MTADDLLGSLAPRGVAVRVGVLSDTHSLLRPEVLEQLSGSQQVIHAGDVGDPAILDTLSLVAPVTVVRGNIDRGPWAGRWPLTAALEVAGVWIYVLHDLGELDLDPLAAGFRVVISGHSHRPHIEERKGTLFLNPGSCGPRRFALPVTVAELVVADGTVTARISELVA